MDGKTEEGDGKKKRQPPPATATATAPAATPAAIPAAASSSAAKSSSTSTSASSSGYEKAEKKVKDPGDFAKFKGSVAHARVLAFILEVSDSIHGVGLSSVDAKTAPEPIKRLTEALSTMESWLKEIPPIKQPMRFGNKAFRQWHARLVENAVAILKTIIGKELSEAGAHEELVPYLTASFGNPTRIDYGTGHELNFVALLICLSEMGLIDPRKDGKAACLVAFQRYIEVMRSIQTLYWLEPAGSKGVWGLDDYNFLPLLWGAAQHAGRGATALQTTPPSAIHDAGAKKALAGDSLYFQAVAFVCKVKSGHLAEHSPMLNDISGVPSWKKVHSGLVKMYTNEVLGKFPIIQHFFFGAILSLEPASSELLAKAAGQKPRKPFGKK